MAVKPKKISHLKEEMSNKINNDHTVLKLKNGGGSIVIFDPHKSMQLHFYDIESSDIPDLCRKADSGRYLRVLLCRKGKCEFTVNGKTGKLAAGQIMMDYGVGDDGSFCFSSDSFYGIEITMQVDTLVEENNMLKMLRFVIESMGLPEEEIFDSDGYVYNYSDSTRNTLDKLLTAGFEQKAGLVTVALIIELGHGLGNDLKAHQLSAPDKAKVIADDVYRCLTDDCGTKYTASLFAEKYDVSDSMVRKHFKTHYGIGFKEYQTKVRMEKAVSLLDDTDMNIGDVAEEVGYSSQTKFSNAFTRYFGQTPFQYRKNKSDADDE